MRETPLCPPFFRNRLFYFAIGCLVVGLGLASRRYAAALPTLVAEYAGDTLWALMVFVGIGFLAPTWPTLRVSMLSLVVAYFVEVSQFYHAPWIDAVRGTRVGGLVLGYGFLWSDLACYTVGVTLGVMLDIAVRKAVK